MEEAIAECAADGNFCVVECEPIAPDPMPMAFDVYTEDGRLIDQMLGYSAEGVRKIVRESWADILADADAGRWTVRPADPQPKIVRGANHPTEVSIAAKGEADEVRQLRDFTRGFFFALATFGDESNHEEAIYSTNLLTPDEAIAGGADAQDVASLAFAFECIANRNRSTEAP
jgi:hypothetical protein